MSLRYPKSLAQKPLPDCPTEEIPKVNELVQEVQRRLVANVDPSIANLRGDGEQRAQEFLLEDHELSPEAQVRFKEAAQRELTIFAESFA